MTYSLRSNWTQLISQLTDIDNILNIKPNDFMPRARLDTALALSSDLFEMMKRQSLYKIGDVNVSKEMTIIVNRLEGMKYGLQTKDLTAKTIQPILASTRKGITSIIEEVCNKSATQTVQTHVKSVNEEATSAENFNNLNDAMQTVLRKLEQENQIHNMDKTTSRDLLHMSQIVTRNHEDLENMQKVIRRVETDKTDDENFALLKGPVITAAQLNPMKLDSAQLPYDIVYYPGAKGVPGMMTREATPRMYILRDQILVALLKPKKKRFALRLGKKPFEKKMDEEDIRFSSLSNDVLALLHQKLNYPFINVGAERGLYITNKAFPNIRFMWLMKRSTYDKIGPFSSTVQLGLPF